jgi:hypothetical protein
MCGFISRLQLRSSKPAGPALASDRRARRLEVIDPATGLNAGAWRRLSKPDQLARPVVESHAQVLGSHSSSHCLPRQE